MGLGSDPLGYLGTPDATTETKGKVRLATIAETITGTRQDIATTPAGVAAVAIAGAPDASTTQKGIIEIATNSEAAAQASGTLALVPSNLPSIFAAPGAIGGGTPAAGTFTTLTVTDIVLTNPLGVPEGGTGAASLTDHGVMLGSGVGAVTVTAVGAANQVFIGQTGADPIWSDDLDLPGTLDVTGIATFDDAITVAGTSTLSGAVTHSSTTALDGNVTLADAVNIILNTTTGTKIGTATTQKLAFFNATPIVQQANTADLKDVIAAFGFMVNGGASPLNLDGGALTAGAASFTTLATSGDYTATGGNIILATAGKGLQIKEGSNARMGVATLVAGSAVVANTSVTANTRILLTVQSLGTVAAPQAVAVTARTASTSFTITSADNTDTSVVAWELIEPAP